MDETRESRSEASEPEQQNKDSPAERIVETIHKLTLDGRDISYRATAGTVVLHEEAEDDGKAAAPKAKAAVFFVAYTKDDEQPAHRPITFAFNGGPGSSSVWLHLGLLGPKRVLLKEDGSLPPPPFHLVENEFSLLDESDLVFIDPVSTGFSRAVPGEKPAEFHDFQKDIEWVGEFIRLYTTRYRRWSSPKFLIGESYGTTRAAGLSGFLQERHGLYLNGIMLISSILNFQTARFDPGNDLPHILFLPTYAATAWYHGRLPEPAPPALEPFLAEVEAFAMGEYTLALMQGDALPAEHRAAIAHKLASYTGLSQAYIEQTNLRIDIHRFVKELLRSERRTVGRLDSRFTGIDRDAAGEKYEYDPSYAVIQGPYTATLNDYLRSELEFESDLPYEILTDRVHPWRFEQNQNSFVNEAETLRKAITTNPYLKVFVANGYYDLATPYLATRYTFDHLQLEPELRSNVSMGHYEAGHMMYVHLPSMVALKADLASFIHSAVPAS